MTRGTTHTHIVTTPFVVDTVAEVLIAFKQENAEIVRKVTPDCIMSGNTISVNLTQEETFRFTDKRKARSQARVLLKDGTVWASPVVVEDVGECLTNDVLELGVTPSGEVATLGTAILDSAKLG